jgi:hypothetical protein
MAIARTANGTGTAGTDTGKTYSFDCSGGNVLFGATYQETASSTMTYNGVSMTQVVQVAQGGLGYWMSVFFLANPSTGANNLVTSMTSCYNQIYAASYSGASTSTPTSFDNQASAAATSITNTMSTTGNAWYFGVANGSALTGTTNATQLNTPNPTFQASYDSNGIASSSSMTVSRTGTARIGLASVAFQESGGAAVNSNFLMFM